MFNLTYSFRISAQKEQSKNKEPFISAGEDKRKEKEQIISQKEAFHEITAECAWRKKMIKKDQVTSSIERFLRMRTNLLANNTSSEEPALMLVPKKIRRLAQNVKGKSTKKEE